MAGQRAQIVAALGRQPHRQVAARDRVGEGRVFVDRRLQPFFGPAFRHDHRLQAIGHHVQVARQRAQVITAPGSQPRRQVAARHGIGKRRIFVDRRLQLFRGLPLGGHHRLQAVGHQVEGARQPLDLVAGMHRSARGQVAFRERLGRAHHRPDIARHPAPHPQADAQGQNDRHDHQRQQNPPRKSEGVGRELANARPRPSAGLDQRVQRIHCGRLARQQRRGQGAPRAVGPHHRQQPDDLIGIGLPGALELGKRGLFLRIPAGGAIALHAAVELGHGRREGLLGPLTFFGHGGQAIHLAAHAMQGCARLFQLHERLDIVLERIRQARVDGLQAEVAAKAHQYDQKRYTDRT